MGTTSLDIVQANLSRRKDIQGELRQIDEAATTETRSYNENETARIAELRGELEGIDNRITSNVEMEIRSQEIGNGIESMLGAMLDRDTGDVIDTRSVGQRFATDEFRAWAEGGARGSYAVDMPGLELRAVTDTTLGATSGGALTRAERLTRVGQDFLDRRVYLTDVLPTINVTQGAIEYVQDTSPLADLANKAVEVTEGAAKPQAGMTLSVKTETAATIAAWANITRQTAQDVPQVQGYLDTRLRYSLKRRVDIQVVAGTGVAPNLLGLGARTGILTYAPGAAEARYRSIRHAITLGELSESVYEIIVLNPADAELFDLSNDTTAGLHAVMDDAGPLSNGGARTAWGLQQIRSNAVASGTALLIDPTAVALFDRLQPTAYMTDSHASNFTSNILTLLLECRVGLGLFNPAGVCKVTFNGTL